MRKIYIENEYGNRINLQDIDNGIILTQISGLGTESTSSYTLLGDTYIRNQATDNQKEISGTLITIAPNAYQKFHDTADFLIKAKKLYLIYIPYGNTEYRRDVDLIAIDKGERNGATLECQVRFACRSLFYTNTSMRYTVSSITGQFVFPFTWPVVFNDNTNQTADVENNGHVEAQFKVRLNGPLVDPIISLYKDGIEVSKCAIDYTIYEGDYIEYSNIDGDLYIKAVSDGTETNLINNISIKNDNFFKIPVGKCSIKISANTGITNDIIVDVYKYYKVV